LFLFLLPFNSFSFTALLSLSLPFRINYVSIVFIWI
jgi:hypothetical protein